MDIDDLDWSIDNIDEIANYGKYNVSEEDLEELNPLVTEVITNKVHVVTFPESFTAHQDLFKYAITHPNCVMGKTCKWRCTRYLPDFTVNMFRRDKWVLPTKEDDVNKVYDMVEKEFGCRPQNVAVVNKTMIFKVNFTYSLDALYDYLNRTAGEDEGVQFLDKQRFPAIICTIKKHQNVTLEIYHKGAINATGMKGDDVEEQVQMVRDYINNRVVQFLKETR